MIFISIYLVVAPIIEAPTDSLIAAAFIAAGIPLYFIFVKGYYAPRFLIDATGTCLIINLQILKSDFMLSSCTN